ncbi:MAG: hypothetical protein V1721_08585 [Pseudomonadota bacterium]
MTQATPIIGANQTGLAYRAADNDGKKALLNHHKGSTVPPYAEAGILWLDDAATPWLLKIHDGTDWITIASVNAATNAVVPYHGTVGISLATLGAAAIGAAQTFSGGQRTNATALTSSAASIAVNLALNNDFTHTLTENTTLANPTNIVVGQKGRIFLTQDAVTPRTLAYGSFYKFPGGTIPALSTTVNAVDVLYYDVLSATQIACNLVKGFA